MSRAEGAELVHRAVDAWNRRDAEDLMLLTDPEIEFVNSPTAVEPGTRRGPDEARAAVEAQWDILLDGRQEIDRIFDRGDEIISLGRLSRRMPGSEAVIQDRIVTSWKISDGRLTRVEVLGFGGTEVQEALKAAGLEE
ncbi:MAG: SnoaL-like domain [Thermoleophilaceae bacterium]|jgi:ketosteroid isomerase-like protein|nr:SnoaL-like domain [Thermoleophilaceae bacterium]